MPDESENAVSVGRFITTEILCACKNKVSRAQWRDGMMDSLTATFYIKCYDVSLLKGFKFIKIKRMWWKSNTNNMKKLWVIVAWWLCLFYVFTQAPICSLMVYNLHICVFLSSKCVYSLIVLLIFLWPVQTYALHDIKSPQGITVCKRTNVWCIMLCNTEPSLFFSRGNSNISYSNTQYFSEEHALMSYNLSDIQWLKYSVIDNLKRCSRCFEQRWKSLFYS